MAAYGSGRTNKLMGIRFEAEFCEILSKNGWWAYNCPANMYGQPADIIAMKGGEAILADCKVCSAKGFSMDRIEENQNSSMLLFSTKTKFKPYFIFKTANGNIYLMEYKQLHNIRKIGMRFIANEEIEFSGIPLNVWLERYNDA